MKTPEFSKEIPDIKINYTIFSSKWDIEELQEDNILKIIHRNSGDSISISFRSITDRINFAKNIYSSKSVKQIGQGMNLEQYVNSNIKPKSENFFTTFFKRVTNNLKKINEFFSRIFFTSQQKISYITAKLQSIFF